MTRKPQGPARGRRRFMRDALVLGSTGLAVSGGVSRRALAAEQPDEGGPRWRRVRQDLYAYSQTLDVIDAHEHLLTEPDRLKLNVDVLTLISHYVYVDLISAGHPLPAGESWFSYNALRDDQRPLAQRWAEAWPHIQNVKYGSYFRAAAIGLRDIYGIDDLNERTYQEASERIKAANTPGLYRRVLRDRCRIKTCLVQNGLIEGQQPADLLTPVFTGTHGAYALWDKKLVTDIAERKQRDPAGLDLDEYLALVEEDMTWTRDHGAVGCKIFAIADAPIDMETARQDFGRFLDGAPATPVLQSTVLDRIFTLAGQWDWPVAVHTGVWGDFRTVDPKHMIGPIQRHPETRFDLYHLGMPFVRDFCFIGKNFTNANLNLCWTYIVSQAITRRAANELIDAVPVNKIIGFGGDYTYAVENTYGHLVMARETLADALADRIVRGQLDRGGAEHILRLWLHDNPVRFYGLDKKGASA